MRDMATIMHRLQAGLPITEEESEIALLHVQACIRRQEAVCKAFFTVIAVAFVVLLGIVLMRHV